MFDTATLSTPLSFRMRPAPARQPAAVSPSAPAISHWLAAALDELDYGIVLLLDDMHVSHINDAAAVELDDDHPLSIAAGQLCARSARDAALLGEAVTAAAGRGIRRLLTFGEDGRRASVSVVPLDAADAGPRAVLVVLEKRAVCESLSVHGFARSCGLTGAETRVLVALCSGSPPSQTAEELGVAVSTVRSQIGSIRQKTGAASIRALVRQVAVLPPVMGVLRKMGRPESAAGALRPA
ncbi:MAG: helix-turn-helix transcriptional regulator [Caldimonas sp.]